MSEYTQGQEITLGHWRYRILSVGERGCECHNLSLGTPIFLDFETIAKAKGERA